MKCENCGGEIESNQEYCSYCGTENKNIYLHQQKVEEKKERNKKIKNKVLEKNTSKIVNKVMTFVLVGSIILLIVSVVASFMRFSEDEFKKVDYNKAEKLYAAGEYGKLYSYIKSCAYYYEDDNEYIQFTEFYDFYYVFIKYRNEYIESIQTGEGNQEYTVESMASYIVSIINPLQSWSDEKALGKNQEIFDECREDAEDFLRGYFGYSDEEIEGLVENNEKSFYDIESELEERMKMVYYQEKGYKENE